MTSRIFVLCLLAHLMHGTFGGAQTSTLPSLSFDELASSNQFSHRQIIKAFRSVGALIVRDVPDLINYEEEALRATANCLEAHASSGKGVHSRFLDGSTRQTFATASDTAGRDGDLPKWVIDDCRDSLPAITSFRDVSRHVVERIAHKCDLMIDRRGPALTPMVADGEHLEHFHNYQPPVERSIALRDRDGEPTLHMHTDAGLLLAMSGGLQVGLSGSDEHGSLLEIQLSCGRIVAANVPRGAMLLLVGQGLADWLPAFGFRAAPHALRMSALHPRASSRVWYGRMVLPPQKFIVGRGITFGEWMGRAKKVLSGSANISIDQDEDGHLGCLSRSTLRRRLEDLSGSCGAGQIYCWLQCTSVANLHCGEEAQCIDGGTGKECDDHGQLCKPTCPAEDIALIISGAGESRINGKYAARPRKGAHSHRMDYKQIGGTAWLQWNPQSNEWILKDTSYNNANTLYWSSDDVDNPWACNWRVASGAQAPLPTVRDASGLTASNSDDFCNGMVSDMFMGGFSSLFDDMRKSGPCLIIFFSGWKLDGVGKFIIAICGALLAGVGCEALFALRSRVSSSTLFSGKANKRRALMANIFLYATHRTVGYLVMLLAMTYSVEIFIAVIVGLSLGHFVFNANQPVAEGETACCSSNNSTRNAVANESQVDPSLGDSLQFIVDGMSCSSCVQTVKQSVESIPDVTRAWVNLASGRLTVFFSSLDDSTKLSHAHAVLKAVDQVGFTARGDGTDFGLAF